MRKIIRWIGLALALILAGGVGPVQAAPRVPPLKILLCELMLKTSARDLANGDNVLPQLRELQTRVRPKLDQEEAPISDGRPASYSGTFGDITAVQARKVAARLGGLISTLARPTLDTQTYAVEFRGANIFPAWRQLQTDEEDLRATYAAQTQNVYPEAPRRRLNVIGLYGLAGYLINTQIFMQSLGNLDQANWAAMGLYVGTASVATEMIRLGFKFYYDRADWTYGRVQSALKALSADTHADHFLLWSSQIELPAEFNRALFSDDEAELSDGRGQAIAQWGGSYAQKVLDIMRDPLRAAGTRSEVRNAGSNSRYADMDMLVYRDLKSGEPVWLMIYRASRTKPQGSNTNRRAPQSERGRKPELEPGLVPVRIRSR